MLLEFARPRARSRGRYGCGAYPVVHPALLTLYLCLLLNPGGFPQLRIREFGDLLVNSYTRSGELVDLGCGKGTGDPSQRLGTCVPPTFHVKILARTFPGARNDFHRVKRADFRPKPGWERDARAGSPRVNWGRRLIAGGPEYMLYLDRLGRIGRPGGQ